VSTYATAIHYTQRQIATRMMLQFNIEYPFRYHINNTTATETFPTVNCQMHVL